MSDPYLPELAAEVLRRAPLLGRTRLVCVDGPSGAGKTVFAACLASALTERAAASLDGVGGAPVPVVHTDDLLDGWDDQLTFWPRLEELVLTPLSEGRPGRYRPYDWKRGTFTGDEIGVPAAPVVVVEGVSAARESARRLASLTVFVTAPSPIRLARALSRDGDAVRPYLLRWRRREERHFAADGTAHRVDLLVDSEDPAGYRYSHRNASGP